MFLFLRRQRIGLAIDWFKTWGEVDSMIPRSSFWEFVEILSGKDVFIVVILTWYNVSPFLGFGSLRVIFKDIVVVGAVNFLGRIGFLFEISVNVEDEKAISFFQDQRVFFVIVSIDGGFVFINVNV